MKQKHIIVFAVYAGNREVSDCISKCLDRARELYPDAVIIAVNNKSAVTDWRNTAGITVIDNDTEYGYELGAYRTAINHLTSVYERELPEATYIFLQGTVWLNAILNMDQSVTNIKPFRHYNDRYELYNKADHTHVLSNILSIIKTFINFDWKWETYEGMCVSIMFITNRLGLLKLQSDNILNIKCKTKQDSCAVERLLGQYIKLTTGSVIGVDSSTVHKTYQNHISNKDWERNIDYSSVIHKIFCDQL